MQQKNKKCLLFTNNFTPTINSDWLLHWCTTAGTLSFHHLHKLKHEQKKKLNLNLCSGVLGELRQAASSPEVVHQLFGIPRTCAVSQKLLPNQVFHGLVHKSFHLLEQQTGGNIMHHGSGESKLHNTGTYTPPQPPHYISIGTHDIYSTSFDILIPAVW